MLAGRSHDTGFCQFFVAVSSWVGVRAPLLPMTISLWEVTDAIVFLKLSKYSRLINNLNPVISDSRIYDAGRQRLYRCPGYPQDGYSEDATVTRSSQHTWHKGQSPKYDRRVKVLPLNLHEEHLHYLPLSLVDLYPVLKRRLPQSARSPFFPSADLKGKDLQPHQHIWTPTPSRAPRDVYPRARKHRLRKEWG